MPMEFRFKFQFGLRTVGEIGEIAFPFSICIRRV